MSHLKSIPTINVHFSQMLRFLSHTSNSFGCSVCYHINSKNGAWKQTNLICGALNLHSIKTSANYKRSPDHTTPKICHMTDLTAHKPCQYNMLAWVKQIHQQVICFARLFSVTDGYFRSFIYAACKRFAIANAVEAASKETCISSAKQR